MKRNRSHYKNKKRVTIAAVIVILLVVFSFFFFFSKSKKASIADLTQVTSMKQLLEQFDCIYQKEAESKEDGFEKDIYLKFGKDLYIEQESNQKYFQDVISAVTRFLEYPNFILIDQEKGITIHVVTNQAEKLVTNIYINGDSNYFGTADSIVTLENVREIRQTELEIQSEILNTLVSEDWIAKSIDLGTKTKVAYGYDIYENKGIEVREIAKKIYNIVFTSNYQGTVLNGITTKTKKEDVVKILGSPTFIDEMQGIYGYKGKDIYVFFAEDGISIYRREQADAEKVMQYFEAFLEDNNLKKFINSVTDLWYDYDIYNYSERFVNLRYSLKGIAFQFNVNQDHGVVIYNNYTGKLIQGLTVQEMKSDKNKIPDCLYFYLDKDMVFEAEQERYFQSYVAKNPEEYQE